MSHFPSINLHPKQMFEMMEKSNTLQLSSSREYLDPRQQIQKKKFQSNTGGGSKYITKKGYYWDTIMKENQSKPSPVQYNLAKSLQISSKSVKPKKLDMGSRKGSYLQLIENQQKRRPKPAPNTYNINIENKIKPMQNRKNSIKQLFINQFQAVSNDIPGPGTYSPKGKIQDLILTSNKSKSTINPQTYRLHENNKQKLQKQIKHNYRTPNASTYTPLETNTFDKLAIKNPNKNVHPWGRGQRFLYNIKQLSKVRKQNPSPSDYKISIDWSKNNLRQNRNWIEAISTPKARIYH